MMRTSHALPSLHGRKALVTGATGFIGSHLVKRLVAAECAVTMLTRNDTPSDRLQDVWSRLEVVHGDLASRASLEALDPVCASDLVFHLAAEGTDQRGDDLERLLQVNAQGTLRVAELALRGKAQRFVYVGSSTEYGRGSQLREDAPLAPLSPYGVSKAAGWLIAQSLGHQAHLPVVGVRLFTPYGPWENSWRLIPHTVQHALRGDDIPLTPGDQSRDFLFIDDAIEGLLLAAASPAAVGQLFNICSGQETQVKEAVRTLLRLIDGSARPLFGQTPYRSDEPGRLSGDPGKAGTLLGWLPTTPLEEGLRVTIQWWMDHRVVVAAGAGAGRR